MGVFKIGDYVRTDSGTPNEAVGWISSLKDGYPTYISVEYTPTSLGETGQLWLIANPRLTLFESKNKKWDMIDQRTIPTGSYSVTKKKTSGGIRLGDIWLKSDDV